MTKSFTMRAMRGGLAAAALLVASGAGTAHGATITRDDYYPFYDPGLVQYVTAKGTFPAVVIANPFGPDADDALLSRLELPGYYPPTVFSATTPQARDDGHLVMIFNPVAASSGQAACAAPARQTATGKAGTGATLRLQIAFCYDQEVVSEAFMEMPRPDGPTDQRFSQAMAQLLDALLPIQIRDGGNCRARMAGAC
ncbi:MAG: hypothetical protein VCD66_18015 [Alphaproteobacteria bacterium]